MKQLLFVSAALLALAAPAKAQTTNIPIPTPAAANGSLTIVAVMGNGPTCSTAAPCVFTWTDTLANLNKIGLAYGPGCQAANLVGSPPVPTVCTPTQIFAWWAKSVINGTVANANSFATATQAVVLPPPMAPTTPSVIPNCGGTC